MASIDHEQRAGLLWPVLTAAASQHRGITYAQAAAAIGIHHRAMAWALDPIQRYCIDEGLPRLTGLVHAASTGVPGGGYAGEPGSEAELTAVWTFDWRAVKNPFSELHTSELDQIADEINRDPKDGALKYASQLARGDQQRVFRRSVLKAYGSKCSICQTSFEELLEAAHIVPFGDPRAHLRINPRNGIALCANHHALFDSHWITISDTFEVTFLDPDMIQGPYSDEDEKVSVRFHKTTISLPLDENLWPDSDLLRERAR